MSANISFYKRKNYGEIPESQPNIKHGRIGSSQVLETIAYLDSVDFRDDRIIRLVSSNNLDNSDVKAAIAFLSKNGTRSQKTKLFIECLKKNYGAIVYELLSKGIIHNERESDETVLGLIVEHGSLELIRNCWSIISKTSPCQSFERTVVSLAISKGNIKVANEVLDSFNKNSGVSLEIFRGLIDAENWSLKKCINDSDFRDKIIKGVKTFSDEIQAEFVRELIKEGHIPLAQLLIENKLGRDALYLAIRDRDTRLLRRIVNLFSKAGRSVDILNNEKTTPFYYALQSVWLEGMKILAVEGGAINYRFPPPEIMLPIFSNLDSAATFSVLKQLLELSTPELPLKWEYFYPYIAKLDKEKWVELESIAPLSSSYAAILGGHVWGLDGSIVIGNLVTTFGGVIHPGHIASSIFNEFRIFIEREIKSNKLDLEDPDLFLENLNHFLTPVKGTATDAQQLLRDGRPVCIMMDAGDHVFYVVISGDKFYLCNRGFRNGGGIPRGVFEMTIEEPQINVPTFLTEVVKSQASEKIYSCCYRFMNTFKGIDVLNDLSIERSNQSHQNCPSASFKMAILALLVDATHNTEKALTIYKSFTTYLRKGLLDRLLSHPVKYMREPLRQIRQKIEKPSAKKRWSEAELDAMRQKINTTLKTK